MLSCCKKRETDGLHRRWGLRLNYTNQSCFLSLYNLSWLSLNASTCTQIQPVHVTWYSFIHEKYSYNIISHECQAIYKGAEVIRTINNVKKPYVIINLKYLLGKQKYTCVDLLTNSNWSIYNSKCMKLLVHLIK